MVHSVLLFVLFSLFLCIIVPAVVQGQGAPSVLPTGPFMRIGGGLGFVCGTLNYTEASLPVMACAGHPLHGTFCELFVSLSLLMSAFLGFRASVFVHCSLTSFLQSAPAS